MSNIIEQTRLNIKNGLDLFDKIGLEKGFEVWKPIDGFNYSVSSKGTIRNDKFGRIIKPSVDKDGYFKVELYKNGKGYQFRNHRLVGNAFSPNPENKPMVDHIDNDKKNNNICNLRWATHQENCRNSSINVNNKSGVKGVIFRKRYKKWQAQIQVNGKTKHIGYYNTLEEAKIGRQLKSKELFGDYQNSCEK